MHVTQLSELTQRVNATLVGVDGDGQRQLFITVMSALYVTTAVLVVIFYVCLIYVYGSSTAASPTYIWTSKLQSLLEHHRQINELHKRHPYDRRSTII